MSEAPLVVVANRLPVDRDPDGGWRQSPGGLVTALEPVMRRTRGAWVGWAGKPGLDIEPFDFDVVQGVGLRRPDQVVEEVSQLVAVVDAEELSERQAAHPVTQLQLRAQLRNRPTL